MNLKTCRHCDISFHRDDTAPIPHDQCGRCHEEMEAALETPTTDRPTSGTTGARNALETQVGGDHYTKLAIQPMQYSMANGLNALQHTIVKYVTRYKDKGGIEDLRKAAHCVELLIQFEMDEAHKRDGWTPEEIAGAAFKQPYHDAVLHGHELYSEADEKRMDVVGQNGPTAEHYLGGHPQD